MYKVLRTVLLFLSVLNRSSAFGTRPSNYGIKYSPRLLSTAEAALSIPELEEFSILDFVDTEEPDTGVHVSSSLSEEEELEGGLDLDGDDGILTSVQMMIESKHGTLEEEEISLLRELLHDESTVEDMDPTFIENILYRLINEFVETGNEIALPVDKDFLVVSQAWTNWLQSKDKPGERPDKSVVNTASEHVWNLYLDQRRLFQDVKKDSTRPSIENIRCILSCLSRSFQPGSDRKVWSVYESLEKEYNIQPDGEIYTAVITSLAKSRADGAAKRAEKLLRTAVEICPPTYIDGKPSGIQADAFNVVLTSWAKSRLPYGAERAENLIVLMDQIDSQQGGNSLVKPNISSFISLIDAYAQQKEWDGVSSSERILNQIVNLHIDGEKDLEPNIAAWGIVISAWAKLCKRERRKAAPRADRLLKRMKTLYADGKITVAPDAYVYITVMNAFCNSKFDDAPLRASEILDEMNELFKKGDETMRPSARSIRMVLECWVRSNLSDSVATAEYFMKQYATHLDSIEESEDLRTELSEIYRTMMIGFVKVGCPKRAEKYLMNMIDKKLHIDSFCFDKVMEGYMATDNDESIHGALRVFQLMEASRQAGNLQPNERVYTSFIRAMSKARVQSLAIKSEILVKRMEDLHKSGNREIQPTVFTLNAVLMACAETRFIEADSNSKALEIALRIFKQIRDKESPDHVTFGNMLRCTNLLPDGEQKHKLIQATFKMCTKLGLVNNFVLRDLREAASEETVKALLFDSPDAAVLDEEQLPREWRNGRPQRLEK